MEQLDSSKLAIEWFNESLNKNITEIESAFAQYRISEALTLLYRLFWDEFSGWYLEMIKPAYGEPIDSKSYEATIDIFEKLLHLIHPFMPFITEELWHFIGDRKDGESLMISAMPAPAEHNAVVISDVEQMKEIVSSIRNIRKEKGLPTRELLELYVVSSDTALSLSSAQHH